MVSNSDVECEAMSYQIMQYTTLADKEELLSYDYLYMIASLLDCYTELENYFRRIHKKEQLKSYIVIQMYIYIYIYILLIIFT